MVKDFMVGGQPLIELPLVQPGIKEQANNSDLSEWVVGIEWAKVYSREDAKTYSGVFANQHIVCKLRDVRTVDFLRREFAVEEG